MNPFQHWTAWATSPLGQRLIAEEQQWLDSTVQDVFGYHALQIGPDGLDALRMNRMSSRMRMRVADYPEIPRSPGETTLMGSLHDLPFKTQSIDLLILSHALEVAPDPHALLREADRVLIPEGRLVILGFNPVSVWRLRKGCRSVNQFPPAGHDWIALSRIKDWLKLLSFDLGAGGASAFGAYNPPFDSERWLTRTQWMDPAGRRWWPMFGGVYFLMAVKRVHHMRLIGPAWKKARSVSAAAQTVPSARVVQEKQEISP